MSLATHAGLLRREEVNTYAVSRRVGLEGKTDADVVRREEVNTSVAAKHKGQKRKTDRRLCVET